MSIGTDVIEDALKEIGVIGSFTPSSPQQIEHGREKLNSMLEMWCTQGIDIGTTPLEVSGDELNEPIDTRNAIVSNLALELAPAYSNGKQIVTQTLQNNAANGYSNVRSLYGVLTIPSKVVSSTTPVGAGNKHGYRYRRTFFDKGSELSN